MKKIYSTLLFLFVVCEIGAQVPTYSNNNTAVGSNAFPWGNPTKKIQWRILANSLGSVTGGNNITVVYFQTGSANTNTYPILNIGLKQGIAQFAGGGNFETGFTNVFSGINVTKTSTTGGWLSFTLTTPFLYDPTQPLFIDVEQNLTSANSIQQYQASPAGPGSGRQYGNYGSTAYTGVDATVANFGIDVIPATPCSTPPTTNSIVGPTAAICPNASAGMNVVNTYTAASGGMVYQWQSSTTSSVGPFTSIPGATNTAYSAPNQTVATWYSALITCTNVTGTITSSAYGVSVSPVITGNVPYYESFEGIGVDNQLPNCSWNGSNMGTNCLTYVSSNTNGRVPRTGSKFASFYYNPGGTRYFYTNGINLLAGVTYSAGLWYQTEYYGYNNWTDLSIMYNTTQTPTGLVSIASTNGPAISNVYKPLSNTFTVPTSGLYYFAVRAIGNTGSSATYLSWDDLSITIPCDISPNSPQLSVSSNSTTICAGEPVVISATGADTFTWSTGANSSAITETPASYTTYNVVGTNTLSGCTSTMVQSIQVNPTPVIFVIPSSATVCAGTPVNLTALGALTYTWSTGALTSVASIAPTTSGSYSVFATNAIGCQGSASQYITVNPLPANVGASSSAPIDMCMNETAVLTASGAATYQWYSSTSSIIYAGSSINISPNSTTTYTLIGTDSKGCKKTANIVQVVNSCVGVNELSSSVNGLKLYPNPTSSEFSITSNSGSEKFIDVIDVSGRVILSHNSSKENVKLNLNGFANGIYYVKIQSDSYTEVIKLVKE